MQVKAELKRLKDLDIIEKVERSNDWVSPIVIAPKSKAKQMRYGFVWVRDFIIKQSNVQGI